MNMEEVIFHWRSEGPNLVVGAVVTLAVWALTWLFCSRTAGAGRIVGILFFGAWSVFVPCVFVAGKIWPDKIWITPTRMHGRCDFAQFSIAVADIQSIKGSRSGKVGYHLHVFSKSSKQGVGIPIIWGSEKEPYKAVLRSLSSETNLLW